MSKTSNKDKALGGGTSMPANPNEVKTIQQKIKKDQEAHISVDIKKIIQDGKDTIQYVLAYWDTWQVQEKPVDENFTSIEGAKKAFESKIEEVEKILGGKVGETEE